MMTNFINTYLNKIKTKFILFIFLFAEVAIAQTYDIKNTEIVKNDSISKTNTINDSVHKKIVQQYENIEQNYIYEYKKPKFWDMFRYIPNDIYKFGQFTVQKENLKWDGLVLGSTIAIIPFDQKLLEGADNLGYKIGGWDKDSQYGKVAGVFKIIPKNISSGVYYMGNGGTTLLLSAFFLTLGKLKNNDLRALNTSNELVESLFSTGILTQTLKRITGRQSPGPALFDNNNGGDWNPFPSFAAYQKNTPNYDAMPSGHIATFTSALTIIATNYPEIKWIKPLGYTLMGVLAFNMVSTKVHWTSDYPIGIFMGYVLGKQIANRRIHKIIKKNVGEHINKFNKYKINYNMSNMLNTKLIGTTITF